jgi:tetratricopeptide (TPR) repeat protein
MNWRTQPVFVSGTFRDFHSERDKLASWVFLAIEEKLTPLRTHLERVDLRVGVETRELADDHAKQTLVLKVCLGDVRRCRPFLIVLVGDRYGWIPPTDRALAAAREADFQGDVDGKSMTALEIEYGLWNAPEQRRRSLVYLRQFDYTGMAEADAVVYDDARAAKSQLLSPEDQRQAQIRVDRLTALKQKLLADPDLRCRSYRAHWDPVRKQVAGLEEFCAQVLADLFPEIEAEAVGKIGEARAGSAPTALEEFVAQRARGFTGRGRTRLVEELVMRVLATETSQPPGLVLEGQAGAGKSALFARLHQCLAESPDHLLLAHAAGIDPTSSALNGMLEPWIARLADALGEPDPVAARPNESVGALASPRSPLEVQELFASLLTRVASRRPVVLLIDALDRFDRTAGAKRVTWLVSQLPPNVRLIATAIPGSETDVLRQRPDFEVRELVPLGRDDAEEIALAIYRKYHRQANPDVLDELLGKPRADETPAHGNALWLAAATEELNLLDGDDFARASAIFVGSEEDRLHALAMEVARRLPSEVEQLYATIFARLAEIHGQDLVRSFLGALAVCRSGLRERDLAEVVPQVARLFEPSAPPLVWNALSFAGLRRGLRAHLTRCGLDDQWDLHHAQARLAAEVFVSDASLRRQIHGALAGHFAAQPPDDPLRVSETMWHLLSADDHDGAAQWYAGALTAREREGATISLADTAASEPGLAQVTSLLELTTLDTESQGNVGERYLFDLNPVFVRRSQVEPQLACAHVAGRLFRELMLQEPARQRWLRCLCAAVNHEGDARRSKGDHDGAMMLYEEGLDAANRMLALDPERSERRADVAFAFERIGNIHLACSRIGAALQAQTQALAIARGLFELDRDNPLWIRDLSLSLEKVGDIQLVRGDLAAARADFAEALTLRRALVAADATRLDWKSDLAVSLHKVGDLSREAQSFPDARAAYVEALAITRELTLIDPLRPEWLEDHSVSLDRLADVERAMDQPGALDAAAVAYAESLIIARRLVAIDPARPRWLRDLSISLERLGDVQIERHDTRALGSFEESLAIRRALAARRDAEPKWLSDVAVPLDRMGDLHISSGELEAALSCFQEACDIRRRLVDRAPDQVAWQRALAVSLSNVGDTLIALGHLDSAMNAYLEGREIRRWLLEIDPDRLEWLRDMSVSVRNIAQTHAARGDRETAKATLEAGRQYLERLNAREAKPA